MSKRHSKHGDRFLSVINEYRPDSTGKSHEYAIEKVVEFHPEIDYGSTELTPAHVAEYIVANRSAYAESTRSGIVSCLSNYIAYTQQQAPDIVEMQIRREIQNLTHTNRSDTNHQQGPPIDGGHGTNTGDDIGSKFRAVELYLKYLRRCEYGTRTHAIVEIIVDCGCCVKSIPQIHRSDLDLQQGTVSIWVSQQHAIPSYQYTVSLSEDCTDALQTYCDHNRTVASGDAMGLFQSAHGSVSRSTIYRSIRDLSTHVIEYHSTKSNDDVANCVKEQYPLTPIDIRKYSLQSEVK